MNARVNVLQQAEEPLRPVNLDDKFTATAGDCAVRHSILSEARLSAG